MRPTDVAPAREWENLERELAERSGLTSVVFDADNARVTATVTWANQLCPLVKENAGSASQVCAMAQQSMLAMARQSGRPVVDECDAGMVKLVVPILVDGELVGSVSACGRLMPGGEVEEEYVAEATGHPMGEIRRLAGTVRGITRDQAEACARWVLGCVEELVRRHVGG